MGRSSSGSSRSTPRGDAELIDFDELEKLEAAIRQEAHEEEGGHEEAVGQCEAHAHAQAEAEAEAWSRLQEEVRDQNWVPPDTWGIKGNDQAGLMAGPRQWEQWFAEDCRGALQEEGSTNEGYHAIRDQAEIAFNSELNYMMEGLEDILKGRTHWCSDREGKLGAVMTVTAPEFKNTSVCKELQAPSWRFFTDAMNDLLLKVHTVCNTNRELANNSGLENRLVALEFMLSMALPCTFEPSAEKHFQAIFEFVHNPKHGLLVKLRTMFGVGDAGACKNLTTARKAVDSQVSAITRRVKLLIGCVHSSASDNAAERLQGCLDWVCAPHLEATEALPWHESLAFHRSLVISSCPRAKGEGRIYRTSVETITHCLAELRDAFQDPEWQAGYQELKKKSAHGNQAHQDMVGMTRKVHREILPRHGFEASVRGTHEMFAEVDLFADLNGHRMAGAGDRVVFYARMSICDCLGMVRTHCGFLSHQPQFHTVGDSHSMMAWPAQVIRHFQGPLLCYNVNRVDVRELAPAVQEGDALCWCFGEIDCRNQVHRFCSETRSYQDVIDEIIARYVGHILEQKALLPVGVKIYVFNVPPPQYGEVLERCWTAMPYRGSDEERRAFVLYFNDRLREECSRHNFTFFDVYDKYTDEGGFLKLDMSDKSVHIADGVHIKDFLSRQRLRKIVTSHFDFPG